MTLLDLLNSGSAGLFRREGDDVLSHEIAMTSWDDTRVIRWSTDAGVPHPIIYHKLHGIWWDNVGDRLDEDYDPHNTYHFL